MAKQRYGIRLILGILLLIGCAGAVLIPFQWRKETSRLIEYNKALVVGLARTNAEKVTADHRHERERLKEFSRAVSGADLSGVNAFIKEILSERDDEKWLRPRTAGVAYENGELVRYTRSNGIPQEVQVTYDHTDSGEPAARWYRSCLESSPQTGTWLAPYWGETSQAYILEYGIPFLNAEGKKGGIVYINYSVEHLLDVLSKMELGTTGYAFITYNEPGERDHWIVAHPCEDCLGEKVAIAYPELKDSLAECLNLNSVVCSGTRDESIWLHATDIGDMGNYKLCIVMNQQAMTGMSAKASDGRRFPDLTHTQSWIVCSLFASMALIAGLLILVEFIAVEYLLKLKLTSVVFSLVFLGEIIFLWGLCSANRQSNSGSYHLTDAGVAMASVRDLSQDRNQSVTLVPTGIFVQSLKFTSPYEVKMTGYVWQRKDAIPGDQEDLFSYSDDALVVFPEAESISISKKFENDEVVGSYFETSLRQPFDYKRFPFDQQDIWIRMWPNNFADTSTVLIPDFNAYALSGSSNDMTGKTIAMGLEEDVVLEGWEVESTFFSYSQKSYSMNFSAGNGAVLKRPELHFNMLVERRLGGVMISHVLPISVVSVLLFGVVMIKTDNKEKSGLLGFSVATVLGYCASLFFVLIVSHISLRNRLETPYFVYLEGFYFVMYFQLLLVSMHDLLFVLSSKGSLLRKQNGAFQKLLYWPMLTLLILLITLYSFF